MTDRIKTKKIMVGNVQIGGNNKVVIQLLLIQKQKIFKRRCKCQGQNLKKCQS